MIEGGALHIEACSRAAELPASGVDRDQCLAALQAFIRREQAAAFGFDFPFGLPRALVEESTWDEFVCAFPDRYATPEEFREACRKAANGSELKRATDRESRTPFSPYNIRLYRQTYFGIRDLLAPLVREDLACVLPMQPARPDRPWVMEICPASTVKEGNLNGPYKGKRGEHREARARILEQIERRAPLLIPDPALRAAILDDSGGDALDGVLAAFAVFRALRDLGGLAVGNSDAYALEGYVYV